MFPAVIATSANKPLSQSSHQTRKTDTFLKKKKMRKFATELHFHYNVEIIIKVMDQKC